MSANETTPRLPASIDRYQVRQLLGAGSFGCVYRAYDSKLERDVALKVLRAEMTDSPQAVKRFLREAKAAAKLFHPHIVPVFDAGQAGDVYYIASAFIAGRTLASAIPEGGMEPRRAAELAAQLASALGYAHTHGVVHRDVKPANTMLDEQGSLHLTDFGLAGWTQEEGTRLTQEGQALGTPAYMAPEQVAGETAHIGPASDLYSAGEVLYELLTGCRPFVGAAVLYQIVHASAPAPTQHRPGLDAGLEAICQKAMAKKPEDRFGSGEAMAAALRGWVQSAPVPRPQPAGTASPESTLVDKLDEGVVNSFGMRLKLILRGTFRMGSPVSDEGRYDDEAPHWVEFTRPFYMGVFPVTQAEYVRVTGKENPSWFSKAGGGKDKVRDLDTARFPVETVSWKEVVEFCEALNRQDGKRPAGWKYVLPTEAQWEYACRAGARTTYWFGDDAAELDRYAWYVGNSEGRTREVGGKEANAWGLYDMHGNVSEWCADWFSQYDKEDLIDPKGSSNGDARVLRGGSWIYDPWNCRAAFRDGDSPGTRGGVFGCRVCLCLD